MKNTSLSSLLEQNSDLFANVLGDTGKSTLWLPLDLSIHNTSLQKALSVDFTSLDAYRTALGLFIEQLHSNEGYYKGRTVGMGGYAEQRNLYARSPHFQVSDGDRCIHLGLDLWTEAESPIYAPLAGKIHSFQINDQALDYGGTIITEHELEDRRFFLLFGHLSWDSLKGLGQGQGVEKGQLLGRIGKPKENGGWPPHLHFQVIDDLEANHGDYPGVATKEDSEKFLANCPNPQIIVQKYIRN